MTDDLPYSVKQSTLNIFGVDLIVHHLNTGQRIIEADSMAALFDVMGSNDCPDVGDIDELARLLRGGK